MCVDFFHTVISLYCSKMGTLKSDRKMCGFGDDNRVVSSFSDRQASLSRKLVKHGGTGF